MTDTILQLVQGVVLPAVIPQPAAPPHTTPAAGRKKGRPKRVGEYRRLDLEIDKVDCDRIDELRAAFGARSTVETIRHTLRIVTMLVAYARQGYEIQLVDERTKKKVGVKLIT